MREQISFLDKREKKDRDVDGRKTFVWPTSFDQFHFRTRNNRACRRPRCETADRQGLERKDLRLHNSIAPSTNDIPYLVELIIIPGIHRLPTTLPCF